MTKKDLKLNGIYDIVIDEVYSYSLYHNVKVIAIDNKHVTLEDGNGNHKTVFIDLFLKYARKK